MVQLVNRTALAAVLAEPPGRWLAVSRTTNGPGRRRIPDGLAIEIARAG